MRSMSWHDVIFSVRALFDVNVPKTQNTSTLNEARGAKDVPDPCVFEHEFEVGVACFVMRDHFDGISKVEASVRFDDIAKQADYIPVLFIEVEFLIGCVLCQLVVAIGHASHRSRFNQDPVLKLQ